MTSRPGWRAALLAVQVLLVASLSACAMVPSGIRVARPEQTDKVAVQPLPAGWRRVAVVPFGGDPAHRRPAEELVAVTLRRHVPFAILGPFGLQRRLAGADARGLLPEASGWASAFVDAAGAGIPRDRLRSLAEGAGADGLVFGWVAPGGASADLALVDPATGAVMAGLRRAGSPSAAELGVHELAMSSTWATLADLVEVLRTPAGVEPRVAPPRTGADATTGEAP